MKKISLLVITLFLIGRLYAFNCPVTAAQDLPEYYQSIDGTSGKQLLHAIQQVAKLGYRTTDFRYDSVWLAFQHTDMRPDGWVWEIYSDCQFEYEKDRTSNTTQTGECKGYNREHAMCQSWFSEYDLQGNKMSSSKKNSPGSDIFHIYPTSYGMNSRRGNRPYGEVANAQFTSGNGTEYGAPVTTLSIENSVAGVYVEGTINMSTNVLEPADEYKGDIARSYFGTMVKWAGEWAFNRVDLARVIFDATIDADTHYGPENNYGLTEYGLAMLLKWHRQDPVSQKEVDRNNGIQLTQGNRNPFIDYPYLVEFIWGEMSGETLDIKELLCSVDERFELGMSSGYVGEAIDRQVDTVFWMVGDKQYEMSLISHGSRLKYLPEAPVSCSELSTCFMGWTDTPIVGSIRNAPNVLNAQLADFPAITATTTYYAVFAQQMQSDLTAITITLNKNDSTDWTLNHLKHKQNKTDGAYWILANDASIVSPMLDLQALDSVAINIRSYQNRSTVAISLDGTEIGRLTATTNTIQRYVWIAPDLTGDKALTFTGVDGSASYGVGLNEIAIYLGGEELSYTHYLTHCNPTSADDLSAHLPQLPIRKLMRDGQLYIQINEHTYDCMGRLVKP